MKKIVSSVLICVFLITCLGAIAIAGDGPAPNSGDGIQDGSGFEDKGAPNSGDGIQDGSGFEDKGAPNSGDGIPNKEQN